MTLWLFIATVAVVWALRQFPQDRIQSSAWLRTARDSAVLTEGIAQALYGGACLVLSLTRAVLLSAEKALELTYKRLEGLVKPQSTPEAPQGLESSPAGGKWQLWRRL